MDGFTDFPMRALQGKSGAFSFAVSEFVRVSATPVPPKVFHREIPELLTGGQTTTGMPVQVQILGGHPGRMAQSAINACEAGATAIDINFGCPAPTVNKHDGGASILQQPCRVREIVRAVREATPQEIPVSAKLRLGWQDVNEIHQIASQAEAGGASWIVIHGRTKMQKYSPPIDWQKIGEVNEALSVPIVANGDLWNLEDFLRCREVTGCQHFMLGRGALVNPLLAPQVAYELGLVKSEPPKRVCWMSLLKELSEQSQLQVIRRRGKTLHRLKQWLNLARKFGDFPHFDILKKCQDESEFFATLSQLETENFVCR